MQLLFFLAADKCEICKHMNGYKFPGRYAGIYSAVVSVLALSILVYSCNSKKKYIKPEKKDIVESVYASAVIKAVNQYSVIAPVTGLLLSNKVREGDLVQAGDIIAQIENANPALNMQNANLAVSQAKNNLSSLTELQAQINTARRQHSLDSINYIRQKELWNQNVGTKNQLENKQLAFEASGNTVAALVSRYKQSKAQLYDALNQANNNYQMASKTASDFGIASKINGKVYALNYEPGELVTAQKPVAIVGDASVFLLEMTVDEVDISRISLGQKVLLSMDAYATEVFEAKVTKIYPSLDTRSQSFIVEAEFTKAPAKLYPGMSAEASVVIQEKKNCLVIPLSYLGKDNKVLTKDGEKAVKPGIRNLEWVEILSGIDEKTELLRP